MIEFFAANWLWIVLIAAFFAMHRSGMGCGMGHGGHGGHGRQDSDRAETDDRTSSHGTTHPREQVGPGAAGQEGVRDKP